MTGPRMDQRNISLSLKTGHLSVNEYMRTRSETA
jgi:hypothetical protein